MGAIWKREWLNEKENAMTQLINSAVTMKYWIQTKLETISSKAFQELPSLFLLIPSCSLTSQFELLRKDKDWNVNITR